MKYLIVLVISIIIIELTACDPKSCTDIYQFTIPLDISAKSDTIEIGDTILVDIAFSKKRYNPFTSSFINVPENFYIHSIWINKIIKDSSNIQNTNTPGAWSSFNNFSITGSLSNQFYNWCMQLKYVNIGDSLNCRFGFIAKDTGTFIIHFVDDLFYSIKGETLKDLGLNAEVNDCRDYWLHSLFVNQSNTNNYIIDERHICVNNNYYLYGETSTNGITNSVKDFNKNLREGTLCIVVK